MNACTANKENVPLQINLSNHLVPAYVHCEEKAWKAILDHNETPRHLLGGICPEIEAACREIEVVCRGYITWHSMCPEKKAWKTILNHDETLRQLVEM